jgi:hydrogenase maturation factor HypF (carbamoyltransferase family)
VKNLLIYLIIALLGFVLLPSAVARADDSSLFGACTAQTKNSPVCKAQGTKTNPANHLIKVAADIVALATGVAAVVVVAIGGFTMITSAGNAEAVANARKRISYAVIGLLIVALAWAVISFVADRLIK